MNKNNDSATPISTAAHHNRAIRATKFLAIPAVCFGFFFALIGLAQAALQDFHDTRVVSVGKPQIEGQIEVVVEFEDVPFSAIDWDAGTKISNNRIMVGAVSEASHSFSVLVNINEDDTPEEKARWIAKLINEINPAPAPLKQLAPGKVALATGNVVVITGKSDIYIKEFKINEVADQETGEIDAQSFDRYWTANGVHNRFDYTAHGALKINTAEVTINKPEADGIVTVQVTMRNSFIVKGQHGTYDAIWSTSILKTDTALQKANKIRLAAPRQHNTLVVHKDIVPDPNDLSAPDFTIPGSIAGGTGTTLKFQSKNGWQIVNVSVSESGSDPDEKVSVKAQVAWNGALSGGDESYVGLFDELSTGVISVAGHATGTTRDGAQGYVKASVRGTEVIVPTEPGMSAADVEDAIVALLSDAGVETEIVMSEPYNPYRGIISDNRLITISGLVGQVALSLDSEDTGITCDHVGILLPRTDGVPSVEVTTSPEGIELNFQGTLQTFNEAARGWQWLADGEQSPLLLEGLPGAQLFRAVSTTASEVPEPVEPLTFVEVQIEGGAIGGELAIYGALASSDSPMDLLIVFPWGTDPVTAESGSFSYQTTVPPFIHPGKITVGIIASDHEGRRAVYSGQHDVFSPTFRPDLTNTRNGD